MTPANRPAIPTHTAGSPSYPPSSLAATGAYPPTSNRVRSGPADIRSLPEAKRPRSSVAHRRPSLTISSPLSTSVPTASVGIPGMPRPTAVSSSAQDWVNAALPPTPALQACTYDPAQSTTATAAPAWLRPEAEAPSAPALDSRHAHCPTPELTPPEEGGNAAANPRTFIKRDDLTAKAIARAASINMPAQPSLPAKQYSVPSRSGSSQSACEKDRFVNGLVGASVLAIESIWGSVVSSPLCDMAMRTGGGDNVIPLQSFVKEVLRRSRTSCSTLQLALYYLHKSRRGIREAVARAEASRDEIVRLEQELAACKRRAASALSPADSYPSPPQSPSEHDQAEVEAHAHAVHASAAAAELGERFSALVAAQNSPVLCGRRMFLAALISASKYLQDRNYSNRAWAKISGLPVGEINGNERAFLCVVDFKLHLPAEEFQRWTERLAALASPATTPAAAETASQLSRSASTYVSLSPEQQVQLASGARANGPLTASARQALGRGHSAAAVLGPSAAAAAPSAREKGFPIATARVPVAGPSSSSSSSRLLQYRQVASPTAMSSASSSSSSSSSSYSEGSEPSGSFAPKKRELRSLPVRHANSLRSSIPSSSSSSASSSLQQRKIAVKAVSVPAHMAAVYVPSTWSSGGNTPRSAAALTRDFGMDGLELEAVRAH